MINSLNHSIKPYPCQPIIAKNGFTGFGCFMTSEGLDNRINELYQELRILILQNARDDGFDDLSVIKFYQISKAILQLKEGSNSLKRDAALSDHELGSSLFIAPDY